MAGKLVPLEAAADLVPDGATVAMGGLMMNGAPLGLCRELIKAGRRDLDLIVMSGGMNVDWLVAAGCVRRLLTAIVSFEGFGLAPNFRRAAESGAIEIEDWSELTMLCALRARIGGVPYIPTRAGLGTDIPANLPERMWEMTDERSGRPFVAVAPLEPALAVVHVHEADELGNARVLPKLTWIDAELVKAAERTIVTAERIVPTDAFREAPERTSLPAYAVDHVVHAPRGAWPTAMPPDYDYDGEFHRRYARAATDPAEFRRLFEAEVAPFPHGPPEWLR